MRIGIAGLATLRLLRGFEQIAGLPIGYDNPTMSALINAIVERGHQVVLFTTSTGMESPMIFSADGLTVCVARRQPRAARNLFRSERRDLAMLMRQYPVDIINAHWSYEFAWAALDSNIPTLVTLRDHALTVLKYKTDIYRFIRLIMNHYVLSRARYLSVNSEYLFGKLPLKYQRKAKVINNFFAPELAVKYREYGDRENVLVSVANGFGRLKNLGSALKAFSLMHECSPTLKYWLIGDDMGPGGAAERYACRLNLKDGVEFLGRLPYDQTLDHVRNAKALLHPSLEETFGMSVLESMVLGTPVIGGNKSGNIPSLLNFGEAGILCDVSNPATIAHSVMELLQDPKRASSIADKAAAYATATYSQGPIVSTYLDYFFEVLDKSDGR